METYIETKQELFFSLILALFPRLVCWHDFRMAWRVGTFVAGTTQESGIEHGTYIYDRTKPSAPDSLVALQVFALNVSVLNCVHGTDV